MDTDRINGRGLVSARFPYICLLAAPLLVALVVGVHGLDDGAYATLACVDCWARAGRWPCLGAAGQPVLASPLFAGALLLPAWLGLDLAWMALILGALGWGVTAAALYGLGHALDDPVAGVASAVALVFSPVVAATLGTPVSWVVAMMWLAVAATLTRRWRLQTRVVVVMLGLHLDLGVLILALALMGITWVDTRRYPRWLGVALTLVLALWLVVVALGWFAPVPSLPSPTPWAARAIRLFGESQFYWLALPLVVAGAVCVTPHAIHWRRWWVVGLPWLVALGLDGGAVSIAAAGTVILALAGAGAAALSRWLATRYEARWRGAAGRLALGLLVLLPLAAAQSTSLAARRRAGGAYHDQLEDRAAAWLREHSAPDAVVLGSARLGYLTQRAVQVWPGEAGDVIFDQRLAQLEDAPPDFCVSFDSLAWDDLLHTGWFQDVYMPVAALTSPYVNTSPFTVWAQRPRTFDLGAYRPLSVRLPGGAYWVGTRYVPDHITPGQTISATLFLHEPLSELDVPLPFQPALHLSKAGGSGTVAEQEMLWRCDVVLDDPVLGQVTAERFHLATPDDLTVGAYTLSASIITGDIDRQDFLYEGASAIPITRVTLGYVVVPWQGSMDGVTPVGAVLDQRIALVGFEVQGAAAPGAPLTAKLYWEARRSMGDYKPVTYVFVHLLNAGGELVAQHDGPPAGGRYPLQAWAPGDLVPDAHPLVLPADLPPGRYRLQAGMYTWPDLDRLPAQDGAGSPLVDDVIVLGAITVE